MSGDSLWRRLGRLTFAAVFLLMLPALCLSEETTPEVALSPAQVAEQATQHSADKHRIEVLADGRVRVPAPLQAIDAFATPLGITVVSTTEDERGSFGIRVTSLGRGDRTTNESLPQGVVHAEEERVRIVRPNVIEEVTTSAEGVQQDFVVPDAPAGEGDLSIELVFDGASLSQKGKSVGLSLAAGRELLYHRLHVTDSVGRELPARFELVNNSRLRIAVADTGAVYPVRIDPTIADPDWLGLALPETEGSISALVWTGTHLYAGGSFNGIGGIVANNIAQWNGSNWSALGSGCNSNIMALAWDGANVYAGGSFASVGGVTAYGIAKWNGTSWSAVGSGLGGGSGYVTALLWNGTSLYAAGSFYSAGSVTVSNISMWDGNSWSALGSGMNQPVYTLAWDGSNLYAGGNFTSAGGVHANYIAKWNGSNWSAMGSGMNSSVHSVAWGGGNLYAGGDFTIAGGVSASRVARWNGSSWTALGSGVSGQVLDVFWDGTNLYAGGGFISAGGVNAYYIAKWNGISWSGLGSGLPSSLGSPSAFAWDGVNLYVAGSFVTAGGVSVNRVAQWNGSTWSSLGVPKGVNGSINAVLWDGANLYIGGEFTTVHGGVAYNNIARWNGSSWMALGAGMNRYVNALAWDGQNLYAGGAFTTAGGVAATHIAKWDGSGWSAVGSGMNTYGYVRALAWDGAGLYAGGEFTSAGGVSANRIAKWNGSSWSALGSGMSGTVISLAWDGSNLYAGGAFATAGSVSAMGIAKWNGSSWSGLGSGFSRSTTCFDGYSYYSCTVAESVWALASDGANLYAGGYLTSAGGAYYTAKWNGSSWSVLGAGMNGPVFALLWDGTRLYAGGWFTTAGGVAANYIARWDGSSWSSMSGGMNSQVSALAWDGSSLYAGGKFSQAGSSPARVASISLKHTIQAAEVSNGSISPSSATVYHGQSVTFTLTPASGYQVGQATGCGGTLSGNTYTTGPITSDCTVSASFARTPTISGNPATNATIGTAYSFTPTATDASSFSISGAVPAGLSFDSSTGTLSGTPMTAGMYSNIIITATNATGSASLNPFSINIAKGTPSITTLPTASSITYGEPLSSSTLNGGSGSLSGSFAFTSPALVPAAAGDYNAAITFTPTDSSNYNSVSATVTVAVSRAIPSIKELPNASSITYGEALSSSTLKGGSATVSGTFAYTSPAAVPEAAGNYTAAVTFNPTDTANYNSVSENVTVAVLKATPSITNLPTASSIPYGRPLSSSTLSGGAASVSGTFAFTSPSTTPGASGSYSAAITFIPNDAANYNSVSANVTLTVLAILTPVNGSCGPSNGKAFVAAPNTNLCGSGQATAVTGSARWSWSCSGTDGGSTTFCSASTTLPPGPPAPTAGRPSAELAAVKPGSNFTVYRTGGGTTNTVVYTGTGTSFTDTSALKPNTIYQYTVASDLDPSLTNVITIRTPLYNGWNIVAVPYATAGFNPQTFFASPVSAIYQWIPSGATTEESTTQLGSYVTVSSLAPGNGYFVKAYGGSTLLAYSGAQGAGSATVTLRPGWTMIASPNTANKTDIGENWLVDSDKLGAAIVKGKIGGGIYWWNGTTYESWSILQQNPQIEPWKGYWMLNLDSSPHTLTIQ